MAYGPVLFVMEQANTEDTNGDSRLDDRPTVRLRALAPQREFDTSTFARAEGVAAAVDLTIAFEGDPRELVKSGGSFPPVTLLVEGGVADAVEGAPRLLQTGVPAEALKKLEPEVRVTDGGRKLMLQMRPETPPGTYRLALTLRPAGGGAVDAASTTLEVR